MRKPAHLYNVTITLLRMDATLSDTGGPVRTYTSSGTLKCRLNIQGGSTIQTYDAQRQHYFGRGYCDPSEDISAGDQFSFDGVDYRVRDVIQPDFMGVFKQFDFEVIA